MDVDGEAGTTPKEGHGRWMWLPAIYAGAAIVLLLLTQVDGDLPTDKVTAVGVWLGSIGSVGAISIALYEIEAARRASTEREQARRRAAARSVVHHVDSHLVTPNLDGFGDGQWVAIQHSITVVNASPHPVFEVRPEVEWPGTRLPASAGQFAWRPQDGPEEPVLPYDVLLPGDQTTWVFKGVWDTEGQAPTHVTTSFDDPYGTHWQVSNGSLL